MSFLTDKGITKKLIIAIVIVLLFNFIAPNISYCGWSSVGGVLLEPIFSLVIGIGDIIMWAMQNYGIGQSNTFITVSNQTTGGKIYDIVVTGLTGAGGGVIGFLIGGPIGAVIGAAAGVGAQVAIPKIVNKFTNNQPDTFKIPIFNLDPAMIFMGEVPLTNVNYFTEPSTSSAIEEDYEFTDKDGDGIDDIWGMTEGEVNQRKEDTKSNQIASTLRSTISDWYKALRILAVVGLLCILVYIGIRMVLSSAASDKAKYKQFFMDWLVAMCLLFFMHYIMSFAVTIVESITDILKDLNSGVAYTIPFNMSGYYINGEDIDGNGNDEQIKFDNFKGQYIPNEEHARFYVDADGNVTVYTTLMGRARLEAELYNYVDDDEDNINMIAFAQVLIYITLVFYTLYFLIVYMKRAIYMAFLTLIAPLVALTYPIDKMNDGKAQAFDMWLKEYVYNLLLQPFHLLIYTVLVGTALEFSIQYPIYAIVVLGFMMQAEKLLRKFFGFNKAETANMNAALGGAMIMNGINRLKTGGQKMVNATKGTAEKVKGIRKKDPGHDINSSIKNIYGNDTGAISEQNQSVAQIAVANQDEDIPQNTLEYGQMQSMLGYDSWDDNGTGSVGGGSTGGLLGGSVASIGPAVSYTSSTGNSAGGSDASLAGSSSATPIRFVASAQNNVPTVQTANNPAISQADANNKNKGNFKRNIKAAGRVAGGVALKAAKGTIRMYGKGVGAATLGTLGMAAGLVSDNYANVGTWGSAATVVGSGVATRIGNTGVNAVNEGKGVRDEYRELTGTKQEKLNEKLDKEFMKDSKAKAEFEKELKTSDPKKIKEAMQTALKYRQSGVTDNKIIAKSMKAEGFGSKPDSQDRILLAQLATQTGGDMTKFEHIMKGLNSRGVPESDVKKYAEAIRKINNW